MLYIYEYGNTILREASGVAGADCLLTIPSSNILPDQSLLRRLDLLAFEPELCVPHASLLSSGIAFVVSKLEI